MGLEIEFIDWIFMRGAKIFLLEDAKLNVPYTFINL